MSTLVSIRSFGRAWPIRALPQRPPVQPEVVRTDCATLSQFVTVKAGERLSVTVRKGDTLYAYARAFAPDLNHDGELSAREVADYVVRLQRANGDTCALKVGQTLLLPSGDHRMALAVALQKWHARQKAQGRMVPEYEWRSLSILPGPVDSSLLRVKTTSGKTETFMVSEDMSGLYPDRYSVLTLDQARRYFPHL